MNNWNQKPVPETVPIETIKRHLDRVVPGFTDSCLTASGSPSSFVTVELARFNCRPNDFMTIGMALMYSHLLNSQFVNVPNKDLHPGVDFSPPTKPGGSSTPTEKR